MKYSKLKCAVVARVRTDMRLTKRINRKEYVILAWTKDEVILQNVLDANDIITKSRRKVYGIRRPTH